MVLDNYVRESSGLHIRTKKIRFILFAWLLQLLVFKMCLHKWLRSFIAIENSKIQMSLEIYCWLVKFIALFSSIGIVSCDTTIENDWNRSEAMFCTNISQFSNIWMQLCDIEIAIIDGFIVKNMSLSLIFSNWLQCLQSKLVQAVTSSMQFMCSFLA